MTVFYYGGFSHPHAEVAFAGIQRTIRFSETQRENILRESWQLRGKIVRQGPNSQRLVLAALDEIRQAYSRHGQSAGLLDPEGNQTPFLLDNSKAIGGVIVTNPVSHGELSGSETATYLHYTFGLQMESFVSGPDTLLAYSEQVTFSDNRGGPLQVGRVPVSGLPIVQNVTTNSFYYATQSGSLTTRTPQPQPESMLFPSALMGDPHSRIVTWSSPPMQRGVPTEYTVDWVYKFRSVAPFNGQVHSRG